MSQVTFGGGDEIWDEVVAALQLDVHLGEGIFKRIPQLDEDVKLPDPPEAHGGDHANDNNDNDNGSGGHVAKKPTHFAPPCKRSFYFVILI
jgi:hypothetical protein